MRRKVLRDAFYRFSVPVGRRSFAQPFVIAATHANDCGMRDLFNPARDFKRMDERQVEWRDGDRYGGHTGRIQPLEGRSSEAPVRRALVWLRRDLRLCDNIALAAAATECREVVVAFNVDPVLLRSDRVGAPIVHAFFTAVAALREDLVRRGSELLLTQGDPLREIPAAAARLRAHAVYFNDDYEPAAIERDRGVERALQHAGTGVRRFLDHVCLGAGEVRTQTGTPYTVYTPYARAWRERYAVSPREPVASERAIDGRLLRREAIANARECPTAQEFGYSVLPEYPSCSQVAAIERLEEFLDDGAAERYGDDRDVPALDGTSRLSYHLRAGTVGVRTCFSRAFAAAARHRGTSRSGIDKWISELMWREFYQMILKEFPHVDGHAFRARAQDISWRNDRNEFKAWCEGRTGYPIVDAAMRQLNTTGWMHNRLRMVVASFLTKDLLIDWRWGERYFERHLADADLAQNNGGWQWAASTGADAAPYFRVFNPVTQGKKFDPDGAFVRRMLPELAAIPDGFVHEPWKWMGSPYPPPLVDHDMARKRALAAYATSDSTTGDATR